MGNLGADGTTTNMKFVYGPESSASSVSTINTGVQECVRGLPIKPGSNERELPRIQTRQKFFRGTERENFSKILEISFSAFLDCFRAF